MRSAIEAQSADRRSAWRVIADSMSYSYRCLRRQQVPVRFSALPTDLKWQQASLLLFFTVTVAGRVVDAAWLDDVTTALFVAFLGTTGFSIRRGRWDVARFSRDWAGSVRR